MNPLELREYLDYMNTLPDPGPASPVVPPPPFYPGHAPENQASGGWAIPYGPDDSYDPARDYGPLTSDQQRDLFSGEWPPPRLEDLPNYPMPTSVRELVFGPPDSWFRQQARPTYGALSGLGATSPSAGIGGVGLTPAQLAGFASTDISQPRGSEMVYQGEPAFPVQAVYLGLTDSYQPRGSDLGYPDSSTIAAAKAVISSLNGQGSQRGSDLTSDTAPSAFASTDSYQPRGSDLGYSENQGGEGNGTDDVTSGYDETDYDYDDEGDRW
jgi:hypothetical protein